MSGKKFVAGDEKYTWIVFGFYIHLYQHIQPGGQFGLILSKPKYISVNMKQVYGCS